MKAAALVACLFGLTFVAPSVLADETAAAAGETRYTVRAGDTCSSIALAHYGDARDVELIHGANPGMGRPPHALKAGTVLVLPPKTPPQPGPDARVTWMRNEVEVRTPDPRPAKMDDPLVRGNRVSTKRRSGADVTFRDETQVKLGEDTLVVILGDEQARAARLPATETTLVTGSLRSRMAELTGKPPAEQRIATAAGVVAQRGGEAQVTVDPGKTTRVAVYRGASTLTAQKKSVDVNDGFGSKADLGQAPTPPRPLPLAPEWTTDAERVVIAPAPRSDVVFAFAVSPATSSPPAAEWHVQLARDAAFEDLLVDERVPVTVRTITAQGAGEGSYFARASAIDADQFEGKWSKVARTTVKVVLPPPVASAPPPPVVPPPAPAPAPREKTNLALGVGGRLVAVKATQAGAIGVALPLSLGLPARGGRWLIGGAGAVDRILVARGDISGGHPVTRVRGNVWSAELFAGYRWGAPESRWAPYVTGGPIVAWTATRVRENGVRVDGSSTVAGGAAAVGLELRTSARSVVFAEIGGRVVAEVGTTGSTVNPTSAAVTIGHRFDLVPPR